MDNFRFLCATEVIFGKDSENQVGTYTKQYANRVLLHYGGGSIKRTGLYDRVMKSLKEADIEVFELGGVQPNPRLGLVKEGIELCRREEIEFILAVGGGSVIDSAKAIALGVCYDGDVWDFFSGKALPEETLGVGVVLTLPAAGSETSISTVITNEDGWYKRGLNHELNRPLFAIMNPELTYTLPPEQTANGVADMMAHIMERYFTTTKDVDLTDRLCEATLKTIIRNARIVKDNPLDYAARAELMLAGSLAHNGLLSVGRVGDWSSHQIEHELSAIYDVAHGAGLAVIYPAWMKYVYKNDLPRFAQFAHRVWNVELNLENLEETALEGIRQLELFFKEIGLPTTLTELGIDDQRLEEMANKCKMTNGDSLGVVMKLTPKDVLNIYKLAL